MTSYAQIVAVTAGSLALASGGLLKAQQETTPPKVSITRGGATALDRLFTDARILVLPFRNLTGAPDRNWIGVGTAQALAAALPPGSAVSPANQGQLSTIIANTDVTVLAHRAGARWVIQGGYQMLGAQIRVTAHVLDAETGATVRTAQEGVCSREAIFSASRSMGLEQC